MNIKKIFCVFFGVVILFVGMWGGAWLCSVFPLGESPFDFAAFFTGFVVSLSGLSIIVTSATLL